MVNFVLLFCQNHEDLFEPIMPDPPETSMIALKYDF